MLERVLRFSLARRGFVFLLTTVAAAFGLHALTVLPIDAVPDITNNQVQINAENASLSPTEIEKQVTFPIETALAGVPGLAHTRSLSRNAFSQVTAVFADDVDIYFARQQILERLTEIRESLPAGTEPTMGPIATGLGEVAMWVVRYAHPRGDGAAASGSGGWQPDGAYLTPEGERLATELERAAYLRTVQDWIVRPQLKNVPGVAGIDAIGGFVKQFHVQPDPTLLVAHGLTFHDLVEALQANNVSAGAGYIENNGESWGVRATGRIQRVDEIETILVKERDGVPIYVRDLAWVGIGPEMRTGSATAGGEEVVVGTALMRIGENSRAVARAVAEALAEVSRTLPADVEVRTVLDRTDLVDATIQTVAKNLAEGALLVVVVLFALLGNFRAALLTALAIPLSMLLTAIGMVESRISGNLMSLGAIDFGLIVDGSVIIVENCLRLLAERQRHLGRPLSAGERLEVTLHASKQVLGPAVFGGAIIITVYVPILFLTGVEGKTFRPMALTVIFALAAAFAIALTFVPAMAATVLSGRIREHENAFVRVARRAYEPSLALALRFRGAVLAVTVLVLAGSVALFTRLGQEFVPTLGELDFAIHAIRIPSTSLTQATEMQREVERAIQRVPEVAFVFSKTGTAEMASDPMPPNVSDSFAVLKPRREWPDPAATKAEVGERIEAALATLIGNNYEFTQPIEMRFNELIAGVRGDVAVKVFGDELDQLLAPANRIAAELRATRGATGVRVEQVEGLPLLSIDVDRGALARYGLSVADVQEVASIAVGGREAGQVFEGDRRFDLIVRLPEPFRRDLTALANLPIPLGHVDLAEGGARGTDASDGGGRPDFLPLSELASLVTTEGPN
ncbi:MAG: CusA/CzcA family heavy metal efflux RND transporter, partial [bacterium]